MGVGGKEMSDNVEPLKLPLHPIIRTRLITLMGKNETLQYEIEKLRRLVSYLAGTNTDHVRVALAGNPTVCDAIVAEARAALGEKQ